MIYFDNAATTMKKPPEVIAAVTEAMCSFGNSGRGAHDSALSASRTIFTARTLLAELFHAEDPSCVAFTMNATQALNTALKGILSPGDHVISSDAEHNSVLRPLYELKAKGVSLSFLPLDEKGRVRMELLPKLLRSNTKAVVLTHVSNVTGNVNDISAAGSFAREHGLLFILDASQSAGVFPIDMEKDGIDIVCFTGHKALKGPQGTGGLAVRKGLSVRPLLSGGSGILSFETEHPKAMPTALEAGTLNSHGIAGLSAALKVLKETGLSNVYAREELLTRRFYEGIKEIPDIEIYGAPEDVPHAAVISINVKGMDSAETADILFEEYGIAVRAGAHCAPRMHHSLGTERRGAVRFSFSTENTEGEIDTAICALKELAADR